MKLDENGNPIEDVPAEEKEIPADQPAVITLTPEELEAKIKAAVTEASKVVADKEKEKLYDTINTLKSSNQTLAEKLKEKDSEEEAKKKKQEEERLSKLSADEIRDEQILKANNELAQIRSDFGKFIQATDERLKLKDVEIYKEKLLATANGKIIPDLVYGETIEAVEASFERSKKRYAEIENQIVAEKENELKNKLETAVSKETPKQSKTKLPNESKEVTIDELKSYNDDQFSKYREDVFAKYGV